MVRFRGTCKDDVDAFVVNMKMLASILGHNDEAITEKFKDIFLEKNIEATSVAMDDFAAMQAKAKQLVMIYKPTHESVTASVSLLVHTAHQTPQIKVPKIKINPISTSSHQYKTRTNREMEVIPLVLEEVKVKILVEEAPQVIIILTIIVLITTIEEQARVMPVGATIMA